MFLRSPKERGPSVVADAMPEAAVEVKESWISELGDELKTPAWYGRLHQLVCKEGKPFRDLDDEIQITICSSFLPWLLRSRRVPPRRQRFPRLPREPRSRT